MKRGSWIKLSFLRVEAALPLFPTILLSATIVKLSFDIILILTGVSIILLLGVNSLAEVSDMQVDSLALDYIRKSKIKSRPEPPLVTGEVLPTLPIFFGSLFYALGLSFAYILNPVVGVIATSAIILSLLYIFPPIRLKQRGFLGHLALNLNFLCMFFFPPALVNIINREIYVWCILLFCNTFIAGLLKDFKDYHADREVGVRTPVVLYTPEKIAKIVKKLTFVPLLMAVAYLMLTNKTLYSPHLILTSTIVALYPKVLYFPMLRKPLEYGEELAKFGRWDRTLFPLAFAIPYVVQ